MKSTQLTPLPSKNTEEILRRLKALKKQLNKLHREVEMLRVEDLQHHIKQI